MNDTDPVIALENSLALVIDAQALALEGLDANPGEEEERRLNRTLANLKLQQTALENIIDAIEDSPEEIQPPPIGLVREIARLTGEVEAATARNLAAGEALKIAGAVLDLATKATGVQPKP